MSMSIKLESSDDHVVSYLKKLWNNEKPLVTEDNNISVNTNTPTKSLSIIQQLIDAKIISSVVKEIPAVVNNELFELSELPDSKTQSLENTLPETLPEIQLEQTNEQTQPIITNSIANDIAESQNNKENLNQKDYIEIVNENNLTNDNNQLDQQTQIEPVTIQLDIKSEIASDNKQIEQLDQNDQNLQADKVDQIVLDTNDKAKFCSQVKENLTKLREIGFRVYHNIELEKEVNLVASSVTDGDINKVYDFKVGSHLSRKSLMGDISCCIIFAKHKSGDTTKPENFRYLVNHHNTIKILDRIWCSELITKCGNNLPDNEIYKSTLVKKFNGSIISTAIANTQSIDNVLMVDIMKAFDSLEWDILEDLLLSNLTRKIDKNSATVLVTQYMTILKNRELYWNNIRVEVSKGIPTGLPSSNVVFTLALEEILFRWFKKSGFENKKEFMMNVYVDDIFLRIYNVEKATVIFNSLVEHLQFYKLSVNIEKTKADKNLKILSLKNVLTNSDYYLGIPFTRDVKLYGNLILNELNKKMRVSWENVYDILTDEESSMEKSQILGFLNYKLKPFYTNTSNTLEQYDKKFITGFVLDNFVNKSVKTEINNINKIQNVLLVIVVLLSAVSIASIAFVSSGLCEANY